MACIALFPQVLLVFMQRCSVCTIPVAGLSLSISKIRSGHEPKVASFPGQTGSGLGTRLSLKCECECSQGVPAMLVVIITL